MARRGWRTWLVLVSGVLFVAATTTGAAATDTGGTSTGNTSTRAIGANTTTPRDGNGGAQPGQVPLSGSVNVHDPTLYRDDDTYYVAATDGSIRSAPSLAGPWTTLGSVPRAAWTSSHPGLSGGLWAPHVRRIGDTFFYYYATSSFGTNNSAIGLKTTQTPQIPSSYVDHGAPVVTSGAADPEHATHNAIDPAILPDENGDWWIAWGSHFDGIMIQRLGADMASVVGEPRLLAHRGSAAFPVTDPGCPFPLPSCPNFNRIEGPSIFKRGDYYYLMAAWDWCCRADGNDNTYKIVIGRSDTIAGPYVDKNGVDLADGGGSIILNSRTALPGVTPSGLYRAPGAPDVFVESGIYYLSYHAYRPQNTLAIRPMSWHDGWPYFTDPDGPYDLRDRAHYRLVNQAGSIADPDSLQNPVASTRCLTATTDGDQPQVIQRECDDTLEQVWELVIDDDGFWRFRSMSRTVGHCLAMSDGSGEISTDVVVSPCQETTRRQEWYLDDTGHGFHRPVVKDVNLALEVENVCSPPASYDCDGVIGTNVVGGIRRDGDHTSGNLTQAAKWPPQQWQLSAVPVTPELLLAAFDGFAADGRVVSHGSAERIYALRHMLVAALALLADGDDDAALGQLDDAQRRIHTTGNPIPSHFVTGEDAATLRALIDELKQTVNDS